MSQTVADLLEQALNLPEADRAELADLLAASLASHPGSLHPAWSSELRRRAAEIDSGQVRPVAWEEVRQPGASRPTTPPRAPKRWLGVVLHPEAQREFRASVAWYQQRSPETAQAVPSPRSTLILVEIARPTRAVWLV